jgi:nucleotide-binding universal stress UspA family protein
MGNFWPIGVFFAGKKISGVAGFPTSRALGRGMAVASATIMPSVRLINPMDLFRTILCPVDFSEHSVTALRYAAIIARRCDGRLHALWVNDPMLATAAVAFGDQDYEKQSLEELRLFVARALPGGVLNGKSIRYAVETGDAARSIVSAAKRLRSDLIVMGAHGLGGIQKALIGSVTERVLRSTSTPVLAVPSTPLEVVGAQAPARFWPGAAILAPMNLGAQSARDVQQAERIARVFGAGLVLVHVIERHQPPPWYRPDLSAHHRVRVMKAQQQLEALAKRVGPGVRVEIRIVAGGPADEISALAAEERIGLVVMPIRKGQGLFGPRAGSIAAHVLRHAITPVLALPDRKPNGRVSSPKRVRSRR